jgi:hypothetical protein
MEMKKVQVDMKEPNLSSIRGFMIKALERLNSHLCLRTFLLLPGRKDDIF